MSEKEKQYDEIIAPMLLEVAKKCKELGMALVARVEWEPNEGGVTSIGDNMQSGAQKLAYYAAHCRGNVDALCLQLTKEKGAENSVFLSPFLRNKL